MIIGASTGIDSSQGRPVPLTIEELQHRLACQDAAIACKDAAIEALIRQLADKDERIRVLEEEVRLLRHRLGQTSQNSHNPPSRDPFVKPRSLRRPSGRPQGGQPGHAGHTLRQVPETEVDDVHTHPPPDACRRCQSPLSDAPAVPAERRQVFELPEIRLKVTEHRLEGCRCRHCGLINRTPAPAGVEQPAQYGPRVKAFAVYLHVHQLIPFERLKQLFTDLFGQPISTGTFIRMLDAADQALVPVEAEMRRQLLAEPVLHCDETGIRIEKNAWLHVVSTDRLTLFRVHAQRGTQALADIDVLPHYQGIAVHDCYGSYFRYTGPTHAVCNAHILRELEAALELTDQAWPSQLRHLLLHAHKLVEHAKARGETSLPSDQRQEIRTDYADLVQQGKALNPVPTQRAPGQRGRTKKTKVQNLLERLGKLQDAVLRFVDDLRVPFSNNQAEQDLRMAKVKQKVSGGFRTELGAHRFYRIRGYVSTARKSGIAPIDALARLVQGQPYTPTRGP